MSPIYRICVLGEASLFNRIRDAVVFQLQEFDLRISHEIDLQFGEAVIPTHDNVATVGVFFGGDPVPKFERPTNLKAHHPIIPVVSEYSRCAIELPEDITAFNAIELAGQNQSTKIAAVILECLGLIPKRRRIFISYRRSEATNVALQLFEKLRACQFDAFLDTHEIRPGAVFQDELWHQLCDSDVMLMLDTETYFDSRWTTEEFGRANLKKAAILRLKFPNAPQRESLAVTESVALEHSDFDSNELLENGTLESIADAVERLRSKSVAVRLANLIGTYRTAVTQLGGELSAPGPYRRLVTTLSNGKTITVYPTIGVPTSEQVNQICNDADKSEFAMLYDHVGVLTSWNDHLAWLGRRVDKFRWFHASKSAVALKEFQR